jgi:hypothetical protein
MPQYKLWLCNDNYTRAVLLANTGATRTWSRFKYRLTLNGAASAQIDLVPNSPKIPSIALMQRLVVERGSEVMFNGLLQTESWELTEDAPDGTTFALDAYDPAWYAQWRIVETAAGQDNWDSGTDAADDVAKKLVREQLGASAAVARRFTDLTVQADAGACATTRKRWRGEAILGRLQDLALEKSFYWRFVPSATGVEFQTAYPLWGLDRSQGNGVNDEMVFSLDRRNFRRLAYKKDVSGLYNHIYVAGQGEGAERTIIERADAPAIAAYKRRESWKDARNLSETSELQAEGDVELARLGLKESLVVEPNHRAPWRSAWNLGDKVTVWVNKWGRSVRADLVVMAVEVQVGETGIETATPELVEV